MIRSELDDQKLSKTFDRITYKQIAARPINIKFV